MKTKADINEANGELKAPINYMGVDQYGNTYHNLGEYPRKALIERTGYKHVSKMYVDGKEGEMPWTHCIGYVVGPHWVTLYEVKPAIIQ